MVDSGNKCAVVGTHVLIVVVIVGGCYGDDKGKIKKGGVGDCPIFDKKSERGCGVGNLLSSFLFGKRRRCCVEVCDMGILGM